MSYIDDRIAEIDQSLTDMNTAKGRAKELGLKLSDYDLSEATQAAAKDRLEAANRQKAIMQDFANQQMAAESGRINQDLEENINKIQGESVQKNIANVKEFELKESFKEATNPITSNVYSRFKVGDDDYTVITDSDKTRGMIKYDDSGQVDPTSPVIPMGKNINGGFILAARSDLGLERMKMPRVITEGKGVTHYPQSKSNPNLIDDLSKSGTNDINSLIDQYSVSELRKLYNR